MIKLIDWPIIQQIWERDLWPNRTSAIKTHSAMMYLGGYDMNNYELPVYFLGYFVDNNLIGVNSGHQCNDNSFRSRGLWVHPAYRGRGIGKKLLRQTVELNNTSSFVWSYPRFSSWNTYQSVGFQLASDWQASETSDANAYCKLLVG